MAKTNSIIKTAATVVLSKTLSGNDCIVSLQEDQGWVHTIYFFKEESSKIDLGHKIKITLERIESN